MTTLQDAAALARDEHGLVVVSTLRADGTIQSSLVNAGVLPHPTTGETVLAFATYGRVKLANDVPQRLAMGNRGGAGRTRGSR